MFHPFHYTFQCIPPFALPIPTATPPARLRNPGSRTGCASGRSSVGARRTSATTDAFAATTITASCSAAEAVPLLVVRRATTTCFRTPFGCESTLCLQRAALGISRRHYTRRTCTG